MTEKILSKGESLCLRTGPSVVRPDPSTHRQAQGGEEDRTTMLRVMVRYSNHEAIDRWYGANTSTRNDSWVRT